MIERDFKSVAGDSSAIPLDRLAAFFELQLSRAPTQREVEVLAAACGGKVLDVNTWKEFLEVSGTAGEEFLEAPAEQPPPTRSSPINPAGTDLSHRGIATLVIHALRSSAQQDRCIASEYATWLDTEASSTPEIEVKELTMGGAGKVYKVSLLDTEAPAVALKFRGRSTQSFFERRMEAAAVAFADAGVGPRRLARGDDWFLEAWGGTIMGLLGLLADDFSDMGELLAKIHQYVPCGWFEGFQAEIAASMPFPKDIPVAAGHVWIAGVVVGVHISLDDIPQHFVGLADEWVHLWPEPEHPVSSRIVTVHGDFHPLNVLRVGSGQLCAIDFAGDVLRNNGALRFELLLVSDHGERLGWRAAAPHRFWPGIAPRLYFSGAK